MTTFTAIRGGETPLIEVDAAKRLSKINPMTYGGFTDKTDSSLNLARHMGRCIYGGIYDPDNPLSDSNGFRNDVLDALRELDIPVIRYPGGNFCATYHWQDGIGPREKRPCRPELAWLGTETNQFGTDEFMAWLSALSERLPAGRRVEPYICLNMGTGTLDEALAWVEYCNGTRDTYYANLRRAHGHAAPYCVKYWALGNGGVGAVAGRADDGGRLRQEGRADGTASWDHEVLQACVPVVDMHSIHVYTAAGSSHLQNVTAPLAAERAIRVAASLIELARIERGVAVSRPPTKICFDEWNVWDPERAPGDRGAEEQYTLSDALAVAVWLNVFVRQSRYIGMANIAQTVNVISPLMTTRNGVVRQSTWWPLLLFSRYMRGWTVATHVRAGAYRGETKPGWLQGTLEDGAPWLDVSASVDEKGYVSLAVVNISETEEFEVEVKGVVVGNDVSVYTITAPQVTATNTEGTEEVGIVESTWNGEGPYKFPKHSFTMLRWKA
ncbi:hypothetical protein CIB48_g11958 [Xylaria polymorpha]|nr:hypothetical protein CIB48_g11958 [Xylaria polymorpha]